MDATLSRTFVFPDGRGAVQAYQALVAVSGDPSHCFVSQKWVANHWSLIVWKLASYIRSKPDLISCWWSWDWVMNQIKYRYDYDVLIFGDTAC